ncbi:MAG: phosphotransferase [Caldilineaceae bacterium]
MSIDNWSEPQWLTEVSTWIAAELGHRGLVLRGVPQQIYTRPWSTIVQAPTADATYFFKAVIPLLAYEAALTEQLAQWQPDLLPPLLAIDAARGWLLMADGGTRLRTVLQTSQDIGHWQRVLPQYAALQIKLSQAQESCLQLGVPDRRVTRLPDLFATLLQDQVALGLDTPDGLTHAEWAQLSEAAALVREQCSRLAAAPIPMTLDHGDFHDGNIFIHDRGYWFFDWGDCSVTHPFFSLRTTFVSVENTFGVAEDDPLFNQLRDAYLEPWCAFAPQAELRRLFAITQQLAPISAALRWQMALSTLAPATRNDYRAAVPSLCREFLQLSRVG